MKNCEGYRGKSGKNCEGLDSEQSLRGLPCRVRKIRDGCRKGCNKNVRAMAGGLEKREGYRGRAGKVRKGFCGGCRFIIAFRLRPQPELVHMPIFQDNHVVKLIGEFYSTAGQPVPLGSWLIHIPRDALDCQNQNTGKQRYAPPQVEITFLSLCSISKRQKRTINKTVPVTWGYQISRLRGSEGPGVSNL